MQVVRRAKVHSCGDDRGDQKIPTERLLSPEDLGAVIIGCTNECIRSKHFGLPHSQIKYVQRIEEGLPVFVFNFTEREMHGIFEAVSGTVNVDPGVLESLGFTYRPTFPATVCVRARKDFPIVSLPESIFKEVIIDNYYSYTRFYFELDHKQADELVDLFMKQTIIPLPQTSNCEETDRLSAPHTDVHVIYRETLNSENIVRGKYCMPEQCDRCGLQSECNIPEKLVAQKLYDWDNYSTSLNSESFSFGFSYDQYDTGLFQSPKSRYVPTEDDAITFKLGKVAGKEMIEAGTFSFRNAASQTFMFNSDENGDTPEHTITVEDSSTNYAVVVEKIVDAAKSVPVSVMDNKKKMQQVDKNGVPGQEVGNMLQSAAIEGITSFLDLSSHEEDEKQFDSKAESVSLGLAQDEHVSKSGEGCLFIGPKAEQDSIYHSVSNGVVQEGSISIKRDSSSDEARAQLNVMIGFKEDKDMSVGSEFSQPSGPESNCSVRTQSRGNYGAMFSWASEVTRFLSWRGQAFGNAERRECRQFLGKLRRLRIMRDESQALALVNQIRALRVKPAKEEYFDFGVSNYEQVNEQLPDDTVDELESLGRQPSLQDQSLTMEEQQELDVEIEDQDSKSPHNTPLAIDGSSSLQKSADEVRLWRSEWLKEAKWRLEDYEHMQNTMFLLENAKRFI